MTQVRTVWRAFADDLEVWECRACKVTVKRVGALNGPNRGTRSDVIET